MLKIIIFALALTSVSKTASASEHLTCGDLPNISSHDTIIEQQPSLLTVANAFTDLKPRKGIKTDAIVYYDPSGAVFAVELSPPTRFKSLNKEIEKWALGFKFKAGQCGKAVIPVALQAKSR